MASCGGFIVRVDKAQPGGRSDYAYLTGGVRSDNWAAVQRQGAKICETMEEVHAIQRIWWARVDLLSAKGIVLNPETTVDWFGSLPTWVVVGVRVVTRGPQAPWTILEIDGENRTISVQGGTQRLTIPVVEFMQNWTIFRESRFEKEIL